MLAGAITLGSSLTTTALAADRSLASAIPFSDYRPAWACSANDLGQNASFLADTARIDRSAPKFLDDRKALEIRQRYEDATRDYELHATYGLVDQGQQAAHVSQVSDFSHGVWNEIRHYESAKTQESLHSAVERGEISQPLLVGGSIVGFYFGTPIQFRVTQDTRLTARTDVSNHVGELKLEHPELNADFQLDATSLRAGDGSLLPLDPNHEAYRLSLGRPLPFWDLQSGVTYGATSNTIRASISKSLAPHLTAVVDSSHPMGMDIASNVRLPEDTLKFLYGIQF